MEEKTPQREDRRVKYTKLVLKQSLMKLMWERPINKISIKAICEAAGVNRGTFYAHYASPYDLLEQIEADLTERLRQAIEKAKPEEGSEYCAFTTLALDAESYTVLFGRYGDENFCRRLLQLLFDSIPENRRPAGESTPYAQKNAELMRIFFTNGYMAVLRYWVRTGMRESAQQLAQTMRELREMYMPH